MATDLKELLKRVSEDDVTFRLENFSTILSSYANKSLLTPKDANVLTFQITEKLMEHNCDRNTLKLLSRYFSQKTYEDLVIERVTNHYCGYPLCKYHNPAQIKPMQVNQLLVKLKMPHYYTSRFCCKRHYQASEFYRHQLSSEALFMRTEINKPTFAPDTPENSVVLLEEYFEAKETTKNGEMTPAVHELMELMDKLRIDDETLTNEQKEEYDLKNSGVNGGISKNDDFAKNIQIFEKEGPQESHTTYKHDNDDHFDKLRSLN